jgi:hypothetical protein
MRVISALILAALMMLVPLPGQADGLKSLLMPGKLTGVHSEFENNCDACHKTGSKEKQGQLCLDCHSHKNILDDINQHKGYHGRLGKSLVDNCKHCHTDHQGRDFNIAPLNKTTFDHHQTDFLLDGAHARLKCESCHEPGKRYAEAPSTCYACHRDNDIHEGKQGKKCDSCHGTSDWKKAAFDHDKNTDFPLKGAHKTTLCTACHINKQYKNTPEKCVSCHGIQDIHLKTYGNKCQQCHNIKAWKQARFDHGKFTGFLLMGKHRQSSCKACHKPGSKADQTPKRCYDCHRFDDHHKGRLGKDCGNCHSSQSWSKEKFDHGKTDFPLTGKHRDTPCNYCHRGDIKTEKVSTECYGCHKANDVHKGEQGKDCASCHNTRNWRDSQGFDHDLASFPLIGMHVTTQCEECHLSSNYHSTPSKCHDCHADDDVHKGRLGTACGTCHNPNAWDAWIFEHGKATGFKLEGAHEKLACYDCHRTAIDDTLDASSDCISCHRNNDPHRGQFGRNCASCHNTRDFHDVSMKH